MTRAVLYGSRAKGTFKPGSDIDLALYGDGLDARELGVLEDDLDELMLPYSIDLSLFASLDHAPLRAHIERVGQEFYRRPTNGTGAALGLAVAELTPPGAP